jgi:hypothetical protein
VLGRPTTEQCPPRPTPRRHWVGQRRRTSDELRAPSVVVPPGKPERGGANPPYEGKVTWTAPSDTRHDPLHAGHGKGETLMNWHHPFLYCKRPMAHRLLRARAPTLSELFCRRPSTRRLAESHVSFASMTASCHRGVQGVRATSYDPPRSDRPRAPTNLTPLLSPIDHTASHRPIGSSRIVPSLAPSEDALLEKRGHRHARHPA